MNIDQLLDLAKQHREKQEAQQNIEFNIPKEWSQGRTVYGGLSAGMAYAAAKSHVEPEKVLRSMTTNFVGPLLSEQPFNISVELIRAGKNVVQIQARVIQDTKVCVLCQCCFGQARPSKINVENTEVHSMGEPTKAKFIPQIPKVVPKFLRHFDLVFDSGGIPFSGKTSSHYYGYMRYTQAPQEYTDAHIVSIIDAWPPTLLQMLKWPAPASTVSWNLEFLHPHRPIKPTDWLAYKAETRQAGDGYGHTEATIWDAHGKVIALSRQTVAVFD